MKNKINAISGSISAISDFFHFSFRYFFKCATALGKRYRVLILLLFPMMVTFGLTVMAWVFFRADNVGHAMNYLLEIFKNDLNDRSVDFKSEWDKSFADVNYDKSQYDAVSINAESVGTLKRVA